MTVYLELVMLLNFAVDFLLLLGSNRLCGYPARPGRAALAAALGGFYAGVCMLPGCSFLGNLLWRAVSLAAMVGIAFGWNGGAIRRCVLFILLSFTLGGVAGGMGSSGFWPVLIGAGIVAVLCAVGFNGNWRNRVAVQIIWQGRRHMLTALRDTGNTLSDPITGRSVLVVGADIAREMLGLTEAELADPIDTVTRCGIPGIRLIPYRAVGQPGGMLLAIKPDRLSVGREVRQDLVAFAPQVIGKNEGYQALAGGVL